MQLFLDADLKQEVRGDEKPSDHSTRMFYLAPRSVDAHQPHQQHGDLNTPVCHFANVELVRKSSSGEVKGTLLLENPCGDRFSTDQLVEQVSVCKSPCQLQSLF